MPTSPAPEPTEDGDLAEIVALAQAAGDASLPEAIRYGAAANIRNIANNQQ